MINVGVQASLHVPLLILQDLKLTTMQTSSSSKIHETRTGKKKFQSLSSSAIHLKVDLLFLLYSE